MVVLPGQAISVAGSWIYVAFGSRRIRGVWECHFLVTAKLERISVRSRRTRLAPYMQCLAGVENSHVLRILRLLERIVAGEHVHRGPPIVAARAERKNLQISAGRRMTPKTSGLNTGEPVCCEVDASVKILPICHA